MRCSFFILAVIVLTIVLRVNGQESTKDLDELSLEDLLNKSVVTASKEEETAEKAPAIIDVITERQIRDMNVSNLYELISFLPGIEMLETSFGRTVLNFRGLKNIHYINQSLLMINGNPIYDVVTGSYYLEAIPVSAISRIEVIRGPGSSLYGTNAYSGVINVITKKGTGSSELTASAGYGSFKTITPGIWGRYQINENAGVFVSAEMVRTDGYEFNVKKDEKNNAKNIDYYDNIFRTFLSANYKAFNFEGGYLTQEKTLYGITPNINYTGDSKRNVFYANARYQHNFSETINSSILLRFNNLKSPYTNIGYFPVIGYPGHDTSKVYLEQGGSAFAIESQTNIKISDQISNVTGGVYEYFATDPYPFKWKTDDSINPFTAFNESHTSNSVSGYTQFTYKPVETLNLIGGLRAVKVNYLKDIFYLPRIGVVFEASEKVYLKALYGSAYRAASFFERYVATKNVLYGSTKLEPEKINTFDFGVDAGLHKSFKGRINAFYEITKNGITRIPTNDPVAHGSNAAIYVNASKFDIYGLEFSASGIVGTENYYGFNMSYKEGKDTKTKKKITGIANITSNGWFNYNYKQFFATPSFQYIGSRKGTSTRGTVVKDYTLDPYLLANLTVGMKIRSFSVAITGKNLLNYDYVYPEYSRNFSEEVPGGPERSVFLTLKYTFE